MLASERRLFAFVRFYSWDSPSPVLLLTFIFRPWLLNLSFVFFLFFQCWRCITLTFQRLSQFSDLLSTYFCAFIKNLTLHVRCIIFGSIKIRSLIMSNYRSILKELIRSSQILIQSQLKSWLSSRLSASHHFYFRAILFFIFILLSSIHTRYIVFKVFYSLSLSSPSFSRLLDSIQLLLLFKPRFIFDFFFPIPLPIATISFSPLLSLLLLLF